MKLTKKTAPKARKTKVQKPSLKLEAEVRSVKADAAAIAVDIAFSGVDRVDLVLEPTGTFNLDLSSLTRPGVVRLRGKKDGKATLFAVAQKGGRAVREEMLHLECEGHVVRLLGFGYIPGK